MCNSLNFFFLHNSCVVVIGTGSSKADIVKESFEPDIDSGRPALPIARVCPALGELQWFLDPASASKLSNKNL